MRLCLRVGGGHHSGWEERQVLPVHRAAMCSALLLGLLTIVLCKSLPHFRVGVYFMPLLLACAWSGWCYAGSVIR